MSEMATKPIQPYVSIHLGHFPTQAFTTPSGAEIHPMWSGEGNLSYLVLNPRTLEALLIDPDLEILGAYLMTLDMHGLTLNAVIDTHTHAEHATAGPILRQLTGAAYLMNHRAPSTQLSGRLYDEDTWTIIDYPIQFTHTPGHAPDLQVIMIDNHLFTGDSLFIQSSGRPDLPGGDAGQLFDSLQRLMQLPDDTVVHPGHDYNGQLFSTLDLIKQNNTRVQIADRTMFIEHVNGYYANEDKPDNLDYYLAFNAR